MSVFSFLILNVVKFGNIFDEIRDKLLLVAAVKANKQGKAPV